MDKKENAARSGAAKTTLPVVVDLGKRSRKDIKKLGNGEGKLMLEVELAVEQARSRLSEEDKNKVFVPVVIIYRKKEKRGIFPIPPLSPFNFLR